MYSIYIWWSNKSYVAIQITFNNCFVIHVPFTTDTRIICVSNGHLVFCDFHSAKDQTNIKYMPLTCEINLVLHFFVYQGTLLLLKTTYFQSFCSCSILSINLYQYQYMYYSNSKILKLYIPKSEHLCDLNIRETRSVLNSCFFFYSRH